MEAGTARGSAPEGHLGGRHGTFSLLLLLVVVVVIQYYISIYFGSLAILKYIY